MKGSIKVLAVLLATSAVCSVAAKGGKEEAMTEKKAVLAVSFGTSYESTLDATIGAAERSLAAAFPEHDVRRAFTSSMIIKIWAKRGVAVDDVGGALARLKKEGYAEVLVQPLHLIPGEEYHKLLAQVSPFRTAFPRLAVGEPLFAGTDSYAQVLEAVAADLPALGAGEAVVLMGHGTHHAANSAYPMAHMMFQDLDLPVYVGTVEGYPTLDRVIADLRRDGIRKVLLRPLMLVAGDHASNDMAGDEDDSWKVQLGKEGFEVRTELRGLGEIEGIRRIYAERAAAALAALDEKQQ